MKPLIILAESFVLPGMAFGTVQLLMDTTLATWRKLGLLGALVAGAYVLANIIEIVKSGKP